MQVALKVASCSGKVIVCGCSILTPIVFGNSAPRVVVWPKKVYPPLKHSLYPIRSFSLCTYYDENNSIYSKGTQVSSYLSSSVSCVLLVQMREVVDLVRNAQTLSKLAVPRYTR